MENKLKIKLKIGNRVYPLTINPDQEQNLRESAKKIELLVGYNLNYTAIYTIIR